MKYEILQKKHGQAGNDNIFVYLFTGLSAILMVCFLPPLQASAQPAANRSKQSMKNLQVRLGLNKEQLGQLRPILEIQAGNLQEIFTKYNEKYDTGFPPFWADMDIWLDLRSNRQQVDDLNQRLTKSQAKALHTAYVILENKVLTLLLDDQITFLDDLDLTDLQGENIYNILTQDIENKQLLMNNRSLSHYAFRQKLKDISDAAEKKIEELLFPDQRRIYQKNKQMGTGSLAAIPATGARSKTVKVKFTIPSPTATPTPAPVQTSEPASKQGKKAGVGLWSVVPTGSDLPQTVDVNTTSSSPSPVQTTEGEPKKKKRGEFVIAPIPVINPTVGNGLAVAAGYLFQLDKKDKVSPPSAIGLGVFRTSNGSWGLGGGGMLHLKEDRFRLTMFAAYGNVTVKFYGIGQNAGSAGISIPINQKGSGFMIDGLMRVHGKWYAGLRYSLMKTKVSITAEENSGSGNNDTPVIPEIDFDLRTAALGPHILYDSRDDQMYPGKGSQFDLKMLFSGKAVGGRRSYENYSLSYSKYFTLAPKHILAARGAGCFVRGGAPFYDLCLLAQSQNLRGYDASRYRDRNMLAAQAEYRLELPKRFGLVTFAGLGEVAPEFSKFSFNKILPGVGAGLRFRLTRQSKVNLRVDYAVGKGSHGLYIGVGEAF